MHGLARYASRGWPLLAVASMFACATLVLAAVGQPEREGAGRHTAGTASSPLDYKAEASAPRALRKLRISGHVGGLFPGATKRFPVRVRNPGDAGLVVTSISADVDDAGACRGGNVRIPADRSRHPLPARASAEVRMQATMTGAAPDSCQDARFPLRFQVQAEAAP